MGKQCTLLQDWLPVLILVIVTDANGCIGSGTCVVGDSPVVECSVSDFAEPSCNGYSDGTATAIVTNGTAPYTYFWNTSSKSNYSNSQQI